MHGKAIWKPGISEMAKTSRDIAPGPYKGGLQRPIRTPSYNGQRADARWVMTYGHKTQSFMKNGGQQKCLDKALPLLMRNVVTETYTWCSRIFLYLLQLISAKFIANSLALIRIISEMSY